MSVIPDTNDPQDTDTSDVGDIARQALQFSRKQFGLHDAGNIPARPAGPGGDRPDDNPFPTKFAANGPPGGPALGPNTQSEAIEPGDWTGENFQRPSVGGRKPLQISPPKFDPRNYLPKQSQRGVLPTDVQAFEDGGVPDQMDDGSEQPSAADTQGQSGVIPGADSQPTPNPARSAMTAIMQYLSRPNAMPPDQVQAAEQQANPDGSKDPSETTSDTMKSLQGDQAAAAAYVSAKAKVYDPFRHYAAVAAMGSDGRPADWNVAAQTATKAMANVPDGNHVSFTPSKDGMVALVQNGDDTQSYHLSHDQFMDLMKGKPGQFDNVVGKGLPAVLDELSKASGKEDGATYNDRGYRTDDPIDPDLRRKANALFPHVSQEEQRNAYIASVLGAQAEQENKVDVAKQTGENWLARYKQMGVNQAANATIKAGAYDRRTERQYQAKAEAIAATAKTTQQRQAGQAILQELRNLPLSATQEDAEAVYKRHGMSSGMIGAQSGLGTDTSEHPGVQAQDQATQQAAQQPQGGAPPTHAGWTWNESKQLYKDAQGHVYDKAGRLIH